MRWFQSTYTARFNARHGECGHLFQGRYKAVVVDGKEGEYGRVVSDYIHLNPARAGLINEERPRLRDYQWSSFPGICGRAKTEKWQRVENVLSWLHWDSEKREDRREYEKYLERRTRECQEEKEEGKEFAKLRRGWYFGREEFRDKLEELAEKAVRGKRRESYEGEGLRRRDEREAERVLRLGLKQVGLKMEEARKLRQNEARKQGLAWLVKSRTVVGDRWIQDELEMGNRSNISRAITAYREAKNGEIRKWKRILHKCTD